MRQNQFYCFHCERKVIGENICYKLVKSSKRGKVPMLKARCRRCDGKLAKFIKERDVKGNKRCYR